MSNGGGFDVVPEVCRLSYQAWLRIMEHVLAESYREGGRREACGLLTENVGAYGRKRLWYWPSKNLAEEPTNSFVIDPELQRAAVGRDGRVLGMVHSHPMGEARPSDMDKQTFVPDGYLYLVVGLGSGAPSMSAYRVVRGTFVGMRLVLV